MSSICASLNGRRLDHAGRHFAHFAQVVRRHLGGDADADAGCAVEQQERQARRQHRGFLERAVVILAEIDRALVQFGQQQLRDRRQAHFGIAHRRRRIAVQAAEVALPVDQRVAQREILRHAHRRLVHRAVAVRVVFTDHVADDARRLLVRLVPLVAHFAHGVEDAPLHRLLPVAHIGDGARLGHRHGIGEIGGLGIVRQIVVRLGGRRFVGRLRRRGGLLGKRHILVRQRFQLLEQIGGDVVYFVLHVEFCSKWSIKNAL